MQNHAINIQHDILSVMVTVLIGEGNTHTHTYTHTRLHTRVFFGGVTISLQMVSAAMKLKDTCYLEEMLWQT